MPDDSRHQHHEPDAAAASAIDLAMMRRALALAAEAAASGEVPVGAVVYRHQPDQGNAPGAPQALGEVLGEGYNLRESEADPTAHAEVIAIRQAASKLRTWRMDDCTIAVTLEPCPMCAGALVNARMGRLVYGAADPKMGCVDTLHQLCTEPRFNHRVEVIAPVLAEESAALLQAFFRERRGKNKPPKPRPK